MQCSATVIVLMAVLSFAVFIQPVWFWGCSTFTAME